MKILLLLLISVSCFAQQPAVMDPILVQDLDFTLVRPEVGKPYKVLLRKNHALLAENVPDSTWVTICYGCGAQPVPVVTTTKIDNTEGTYLGTWAHPSNISGHHNNTISWSCTPDAALVYKFDGNEIAWFTENLNTHGIIEVTVDDQVSMIDLYSITAVQQKRVFEKKGLANGNHTIRLRVTGQKNPSSLNVCLVHDYFEVKKTQ